MQKYQVFIDEHFISFSEDLKSNQQFKTVFKLINPDIDDMNFIVQWLIKEKETKIIVQLIANDKAQLWKLFQSNLQLIEAAGGVVQNTERQVLFIHRLGKWDLPKGKIENGETPEESALREVEEECGITQLTLGEALPETYHIYSHKGRYILKKTYWFSMSYSGNESLVPQTEEDIEKVVWVDTNQLSQQLENTYASLKPIIGMITT